MKFLCLAPNFTSSPKLTPFSMDRVIPTPLRDMKMYRNMRGSTVKSLAKPLKISELYNPSNLVSDDISFPEPGELIPNDKVPPKPDELLEYLLDILAAPVYDVAIESPLEKAEKISEKLGVEFYVKREDKQKVLSFKLRGAYNMMSKLTEADLQKGVVAASAGNHAQGVALAGYNLKCHATIFMPTTTPQIKIDAVNRLGGEYVTVKSEGETFDESLALALKYAEENNLKFIPPYDDPEIIKGQGTIGVEINRQLKNIYAVFVPVGGGGLISGVAAFFKQVAPDTKIIGVEPYGAASMTLALQKGEPTQLKWVDNFADGVAVGKVGDSNFELCQQLVDGMVLMHRDGISAGLKDMYDEDRKVLETSGALAIAGAEAYCKYYGIKDKNIVAIASGANMDFSKLKLVAELAEVGAGNAALLATVMPEEPGSLLKFVEKLGSFNITEFTYRTRSATRKALALYSVDIDPDQPEKIQQIIEGLNSAGFYTVDLSYHDLAQEHLRHLVAGGAANLSDEIICQFIFPEIAGAMKKFLQAFSPRWNITLFRYREQGELDGNVLVGFQVPQSEMNEFKNQAEKLGYRYAFESLDEALKLIVE